MHKFYFRSGLSLGLLALATVTVAACSQANSTTSPTQSRFSPQSTVATSAEVAAPIEQTTIAPATTTQVIAKVDLDLETAEGYEGRLVLEWHEPKQIVSASDVSSACGVSSLSDTRPILASRMVGTFTPITTNGFSWPPGLDVGIRTAGAVHNSGQACGDSTMMNPTVSSLIEVAPTIKDFTFDVLYRGDRTPNNPGGFEEGWQSTNLILTDVLPDSCASNGGKKSRAVTGGNNVCTIKNGW